MIFHLHIPKCGGSSLNTILQREYPNWRSIKTWRQMAPDKWLPEWGTPEEVIGADCVAGHYHFGWFNLLAQHLPEERRRAASYPTVLTMVRDPIERLLSLYHYWRENAQVYQAELRTMTFEAFALSWPERREWHVLDNDMTRRLSEGRQDVAITGRDLDAAKRNLGHVPLVGLTERFDESVERWAEMFGWGSTEYERRLAQPDRLRKADLGANLIAELERRQRFDYALYHYVQERDW